jgi:transcriptional regulator with XRE-family HTH domain
MIEDKERAKRLNEVYRYLYANKGVVSQTLFASQIGVQRSALSAAMNGNKLYLTNNLFMKVCAAYPDTFDLDYLLTGEGSLLVEQKDDPAIPSKMQDMIEQYKREIKRLTDSIEPYKQEIQRLNNTIENQREIIGDLKVLVNHFKSQYHYIQPDDDNPFVSDNTPVNVFDKKK